MKTECSLKLLFDCFDFKHRFFNFAFNAVHRPLDAVAHLEYELLHGVNLGFVLILPDFELELLTQAFENLLAILHQVGEDPESLLSVVGC